MFANIFGPWEQQQYFCFNLPAVFISIIVFSASLCENQAERPWFFGVFLGFGFSVGFGFVCLVYFIFAHCFLFP